MALIGNPREEGAELLLQAGDIGVFQQLAQTETVRLSPGLVSNEVARRALVERLAHLPGSDTPAGSIWSRPAEPHPPV